MSMLLDDLRSAFRAVHQQGGVSLVVLMTLALAIGANSAMFTVVNPVLLRPLPFERPDKVVMLFEREASGQGSMIWG